MSQNEAKPKQLEGAFGRPLAGWMWILIAIYVVVSVISALAVGGMLAWALSGQEGGW